MKSSSTLPTVSVAICSLDRPVSLERLLRTVWAQTFRPLEIIIIDSSGLPKERLDGWQTQARELGIAWEVRRVLIARLTRMRNLAAQLAKGQIVQFLDEDMTLGSDYLECVVRVFAATKAENIGGVEGAWRDPRLADPRERWLQRGLKAAGWWTIRQRRRMWPRQTLPPHCVERPCFSYAAAYRREVFNDFSYDETLEGVGLGEEQQFSLRVARRWRLVRSWEAIATKHHDPAGRPDWYVIGRQTVRHNLFTYRTSVPRGFGDRLVSAWTITLATACFAGYALSKRTQPGWDSFRGMCREYANQGLQLLVPESLREMLRRPLPQGPPDVRKIVFLLKDFQETDLLEPVLTLARGLAERGHQPQLWALYGGKPPTEKVLQAGFPICLGQQRDWLDPGCAVRMARACQRQQVDTICVVGEPGETLRWSVLSRLHHRHQVVWWSPLPPVRLDWLAEWLLRRVLPFVSAVLGPPKDAFAEMCQNLDLPVEKAKVLPDNGSRQIEAFLSLYPRPGIR